MQDMAGKQVVVTGASSGIGFETALGLAKMGASVALLARDRIRGERALAAVQTASVGGKTSLFFADFASLAEVRRVAQELDTALPRLDVLVNNAGAMYPERKLTEDGFETTFAVNHLAPFLLTTLLLPKLKASAPSRVVNVSSEAHRWSPIRLDDLQSERTYDALIAYGQSKTANVLFSNELAHRLAGTGVTSNSLHPGLVATNFGKHVGGWTRLFMTLVGPLLTSAAAGARTSIYLASSPEVAGVTGCYFKDSRAKEPSPQAVEAEAQHRLWDLSEDMVSHPGRGRASPSSFGPAQSFTASTVC